MGFDYANFFLEEEEQLDEVLEKQYQEFFEVIRIYLILALILCIFLFISNAIISKYKNRDLNSEVPSNRQDRLTYSIAIKLCIFGLAIALSIGFLLPITIFANEVILICPEDQYPNLRWLNDNLIKQLWHFIFIFSNFCFILIPFSYFFAESTGFSRSTDNFYSRIIQACLETTLTLTIISSFIFIGLSSIFPILKPNFLEIITFWVNFPFLYSCISAAGAILLLVCTPKGILNLVILLDEYMTRPYLVNTTTEKYDRTVIKETVLKSRMQLLSRFMIKYGSQTSKVLEQFSLFKASKVPNLNSKDSLQNEIAEHAEERKKLFSKLSLSWIRSKLPWLFYSLAMALLISTTAFSCAIVLINLLTTLFNFEDTRAEPFVLGITSLSKIGLLGACIQTLLIFYFWCASIVGLYLLPILNCLRPIQGRTPFFKIMLNCLLLLILSSALPVFSRTVGITNFDLFGKFGEIIWIRKYHLVLCYNCAFLVALIICLCHNIVLKLSREFFYGIKSVFYCLKRCLEGVYDSMKFIKNMNVTSISYSTNPVAEESNQPGGRINVFLSNTLGVMSTYLISLFHLRTINKSHTINSKKLS